MEVIEENTVLMEGWFTNHEVTSKIVISSINISDNVSIVHDYHNYGDSIWDDCGNATESLRNVATYYFNNFPFTITTEFYKQGEENGFEFVVSDGNNGAKYKFKSQTSSSGNTIELLENHLLNNENHEEIFKINFGQSQEPNEIKNIFYAKELGIVFIELNNGVALTLD